MNRVTQAEFARLAGVNRSTVTRWLKAGRIQAAADGRIDPEAAARMRAATESPLPHHQARKVQFDEARTGAGQGQEPFAPPAASAAPAGETESLEGLGHQLKRATVDLQRHKAELAAMEVDKLAGTLVELAEVQYVLGDLGATLRGLLEGLPDRLAGEIAAHQGNVNAIHKSLEDAAREVLVAVSEQMESRMGRLGA